MIEISGGLCLSFWWDACVGAQFSVREALCYLLVGHNRGRGRRVDGAPVLERGLFEEVARLLRSAVGLHRSCCYF